VRKQFAAGETMRKKTSTIFKDLNEYHVQLADKIIAFYKKEQRLDDDEFLLRDFLASLMLWCKRNGIDFEDELRIGVDNFLGDLSDEREEAREYAKSKQR
jgi:hypothetical protein